MNWEFFKDEGKWECFSQVHDQGNPFRWVIQVCRDGKFDVNESDTELCNGVAVFDTLAAAKAFCESSESTFTALEVESLRETRSRLADEYEHAKACEKSMTLGTIGVVAAFGSGMREILLSSQQREAVKLLVSQMFEGDAVPLSNTELPLEAKSQ